MKSFLPLLVTKLKCGLDSALYLATTTNVLAFFYFIMRNEGKGYGTWNCCKPQITQCMLVIDIGLCHVESKNLHVEYLFSFHASIFLNSQITY